MILKNRYIKLFGIVALLCLGVDSCLKEELAENQKNNFVKLFGGTLSCEGKKAYQLPDGTFIVLGYTSNNDKKGMDIFLAKADIYGNELWHKNIGDSTDDKAIDLKILADGSFIILGNTTVKSSSGLISNIYLVKADSVGNPFSFSKIGGDQNITASSMIVKANMDMVVAGTLMSGTDKTSAVLVLIDSAQNNIKTRILSYDGNQTINSLVEKDGNYILLGSNAGNPEVKGSSDIFCVSSNGFKWFAPQHIGNNGADYGKVIKLIDDTSFMCLATYGSQNDSGSNIVLMKFAINDKIDTIWTKSYGTINNDDAAGFEITDSGFAICGSTTNKDGSTKILVLATDKMGNPLSQKIIGGQGNQRASNIIQAKDGGYIIVGTNEYSTNSVLLLLKMAKL